MASLRNDPQGKGYAQLLLAMPIAVSRAVAARHRQAETRFAIPYRRAQRRVARLARATRPG
jgi:hypothetical protein